MGRFRGETEKKYCTRESGEYKSIKYFCIYYNEREEELINVDLFIHRIYPAYSEEVINKTRELNIKIEKDVIQTTLGDYQPIIDNISFSYFAPTQTSDINEIEKKITNEIETILSKLISVSKVIEGV